ncbi:MAG: putative TIM-barrel fold metal-dependent hydrolase [Natronomonas sp.]|jgi:predicted TIM-barrel fold metal-dependent hydrolase
MAPIPYEDERASMEVLDMVENDPGFVGAYMITPGSQKPLGNRKCEPIYERCEKMGLPVNFHSAGADIDSNKFEDFETMLATHTPGFLEHNMEQLTSLIVQGIPKKYPDLDMAFMECGVTWLASYLSWFDDNYLKRPGEAPHLEQKPSEYVKDIYFGTQPFESTADPQFLEGVFNVMDGANTFMYSSDWPHWDYDRPSMVTDLPFLSEE